MKRQEGFALLMVLWTMVPLALLVTQLVAAGRTEVQIAGNQRAGAVAEAAADGAVHAAILHLLQNAWVPDGQVRMLNVEGAAIEVRVRSEAGKVNPNTAAPEELRALLANLGVEAARAGSLSRAIVDARPAGAGSVPGRQKPESLRGSRSRFGPPRAHYDSLAELGLIVGMTPSIFARVEPFLSVYQEGDLFEAGDLFPGAAPQSARSPGWYFGSAGRVMVATVEAAASGAGGGRFTRRAVVRLRADASSNQAPYEILTWDTGRRP